MDLVKEPVKTAKKNQWKKKLGIAAKEFAYAALMGSAGAMGAFLFNRTIQRQGKTAEILAIRKAS